MTKYEYGIIHSMGDNLKMPYGVAEKDNFDALFGGLENNIHVYRLY